eukprot:426226_1
MVGLFVFYDGKLVVLIAQHAHITYHETHHLIAFDNEPNEPNKPIYFMQFIITTNELLSISLITNAAITNINDTTQQLITNNVCQAIQVSLLCKLLKDYILRILFIR